MLIVWPMVSVLLVVLGAQALLVSGARAHADAAASAGLRSIWEGAAVSGLSVPGDGDVGGPVAVGGGASLLAAAAHDAVASTAGRQGWRWWTPAGSVVRSDWCHRGADVGLQPPPGESGWVRVAVTGDVFGPFSALWPGRLDTVHASAEGPMLLAAPAGSPSVFAPSAALAVC